MRLVIDYTRINKFTLPDHYPLKDVESIISKLSNRKYFSKIDLSQGYYQVPMAQNSIPYTSFVVPQGQFEFLRMPFGLTTAPQSFQRAIEKLFKDEPDIFIYLDDLLIANESLDDHYRLLLKVNKIVQDNNIKVNIRKSEFFKTTIKYLGRVISNGTEKADLSDFNSPKLEKEPSNRSQLRSIIGYINFFRPFIYQCSNLITPLTQKLKKTNGHFKWNEEDRNVIKRVKEEIMRNQALLIPNSNEPYTLYTDASNQGISGVLTQKNKLVRLFQ